MAPALISAYGVRQESRLPPAWGRPVVAAFLVNLSESAFFSLSLARVAERLPHLQSISLFIPSQSVGFRTAKPQSPVRNSLTLPSLVLGQG